MVFVAVGSQKFQFDRLLEAVDACAGDGTIDQPVFAQVGCSAYVPRHCEHTAYLGRDEFAALVQRCDVLVTHGGTGTIVGALKKGKRVIAMPRLARYGEHVDDHQVQLLGEFEAAGLIHTCHDRKSLAAAYAQALAEPPRRYEENNQRFLADLDLYLSAQ